MQIDGCKKDLSKEKDYYQRYRICEDHLKMGRLIKDGIPQRFCQQCGRFHLLADFDANKRYSPLKISPYSGCICTALKTIKGLEKLD